MPEQRRPADGRPILSAGAVIAASALTLLANVASGFAACGTENSGCARAGPPRLWRGRVYAGDGRPIAHAVVNYYFSAAQRHGAPGTAQIAVEADDEGRYCLV